MRSLKKDFAKTSTISSVPTPFTCHHYESVRRKYGSYRAISCTNFPRQYALSPRDFSPATLEACQAYSWPGNLRELEIFVKRYLMTGDKELAFERTGQRWMRLRGNIALTLLRASNGVQSSSLIQSRVASTGP